MGRVVTLSDYWENRSIVYFLDSVKDVLNVEDFD